MSSLSPRHRQVLATAFGDIHRRLAALEATMAESRRQGTLFEYEDDLSAAEWDAVRELFEQIRQTTWKLAQEYDIPLQSQRTSLRHALLGSLTLLRVAVDDLGPRRLRGYGRLDRAAKQDLHKIEDELSRLVNRLCASLRPATEGPDERSVTS